MSTLRALLRKIPLLVPLKRLVWGKVAKLRATRVVNVCEAFPLYAARGAGDPRVLARLTLESVNRLLPVVSALAGRITDRKATVIRAEDFPASASALAAAAELKECLDRHGSDKANHHDYHYVYGQVLADRLAIRNVLEVGIGTNNPRIPSNMGSAGQPGASLRAFRDYLPGARIFGADVDRDILRPEERIEMHYVDQTEPATFAALDKFLPERLDLIIDDGIHTPDANIATLDFGLGKVKPGGWIVIEDIPRPAIPLWEVVAALLPANYRPFIITSRYAVLFAVQRLD